MPHNFCKSSYVTLVLLAVALGCTKVPESSRLASLSSWPKDLGAPVAAGASVGASAPAEVASAFGQLTMTIRWPDRRDARSARAPYRPQVIPPSTAKLEISLTSGSTVIASMTIDRPASEVTSTVTFMRLASRTGLTATVKAHPAGFLGTTTAQKSGTFNILAGLDTPLTITLDSLYVPTVSAANPSGTTTSATLAVTGTIFAPEHMGTTKPTVTYTRTGGETDTVPDANITVVDDTHMTLVLPSDAIAGNLTVTHDGVSSGTFAYSVPTPTPTAAAAEGCQAGTYASNESCASCPAGTFNPFSGATSIDQCLTSPSGTYASEGASQPASCLAGTYNPFVGKTSIDDCLTSPTGTYASEGASLPVYCPAGTYNPFVGKTSIDQCLISPTGTYASEGASLPVYCPAGTYNPDSGATSVAQCLGCPEGTTSEPGSSQCI